MPVFLFNAFADEMHAQNVPCSVMQNSQVSTTTDPSCALAPFSHQHQWINRVWDYNTRTDATIATQDVTAAATGWCSGFGFNCLGVQDVPTMTLPSGATAWLYQDKITEIPPGGVLKLLGWGCAWAQITYSGRIPTSRMCPPLCPTPNPQCVDSASGIRGIGELPTPTGPGR
jgi:hypothetical protein